MAKDTYTSKGQRPNVSKSVRKLKAKDTGAMDREAGNEYDDVKRSTNVKSSGGFSAWNRTG